MKYIVIAAIFICSCKSSDSNVTREKEMMEATRKLNDLNVRHDSLLKAGAVDSLVIATKIEIDETKVKIDLLQKEINAEK